MSLANPVYRPDVAGPNPPVHEPSRRPARRRPSAWRRWIDRLKKMGRFQVEWTLPVGMSFGLSVIAALSLHGANLPKPTPWNDVSTLPSSQMVGAQASLAMAAQGPRIP